MNTRVDKKQVFNILITARHSRRGAKEVVKAGIYTPTKVRTRKRTAEHVTFAKNRAFSKQIIKLIGAGKNWKVVETTTKQATSSLASTNGKMRVAAVLEVFKVKTDAKERPIAYKIRLVAQNFTQKCDTSLFERYLAVAGIQKLHVRHLDVKCAYLNKDPEVEFYLEPSRGFKQE
ncbi:hypothetical protein KM043_017054 [Ampulex compressa]|nr:hypothetical protein KM043_017054 [Ampulex compressa]